MEWEGVPTFHPTKGGGHAAVVKSAYLESRRSQVRWPKLHLFHFNSHPTRRLHSMTSLIFQIKTFTVTNPGGCWDWWGYNDNAQGPPPTAGEYGK